MSHSSNINHDSNNNQHDRISDGNLLLLRMLADLGQASAQYNLGIIYESGRGAVRDYALAATWFRKAAEQGHTKAQYNLGVCYAKGRGVPMDEAEAVKW